MINLYLNPKNTGPLSGFCVDQIYGFLVCPAWKSHSLGEFSCCVCSPNFPGEIFSPALRFFSVVRQKAFRVFGPVRSVPFAFNRAILFPSPLIVSLFVAVFFRAGLAIHLQAIFPPSVFPKLRNAFLGFTAKAVFSHQVSTLFVVQLRDHIAITALEPPSARRQFALPAQMQITSLAGRRDLGRLARTRLFQNRVDR